MTLTMNPSTFYMTNFNLELICYYFVGMMPWYVISILLVVEVTRCGNLQPPRDRQP